VIKKKKTGLSCPFYQCCSKSRYCGRGKNYCSIGSCNSEIVEPEPVYCVQCVGCVDCDAHPEMVKNCPHTCKQKIIKEEKKSVSRVQCVECIVFKLFKFENIFFYQKRKIFEWLLVSNNNNK